VGEVLEGDELKALLRHVLCQYRKRQKKSTEICSQVAYKVFTFLFSLKNINQ
jgi:hypothetical protein